MNVETSEIIHGSHVGVVVTRSSNSKIDDDYNLVLLLVVH